MPQAASIYEAVLPSWEAEAKFEPLWVQSAPPVLIPEPQAEETSRDVEDDYRRGFEDGQASAESSFASALTLARQNIQSELMRSQEEQLMASVKQLADQLGDQLASFETQLRQSVVNVLEPIVSKQIAETEQRVLLSEIDRIIELNGLAVVRIAGPEKFLRILNAALRDRGLDATSEVRDGPEINVSIDDVELRSRLPEWVMKLEAIFG